MIDLIPNEILLMIFLKLQPFNFTVDDGRWTRSTRHAHQYQKYHEGIITTRNSPVLLVLARVSKKFRAVAFMHPLFTKMQFYRLYPNQIHWNLNEILNLSMWTQMIMKKWKHFHTNSIIIDHPHLTEMDVCTMLSKIAQPLKVRDIVLHLGWLCLGNPSLLQELKKFKKVQRLYLGGKPDPSVLRGFDNSAIVQLSKSFDSLESLYIEGYGGGSFTWLALRKLLLRNPSIQVLSLGYVRNGLDLTELGKILPNLTTLTIHFSSNPAANLMQHDNDWPGYFATLARGIENTRNELVPEIKGSLAGSSSLKNVYFRNPPSSGLPRLMQALEGSNAICHTHNFQ